MKIRCLPLLWESSSGVCPGSPRSFCESLSGVLECAERRSGERWKVLLPPPLPDNAAGAERVTTGTGLMMCDRVTTPPGMIGGIQWMMHTWTAGTRGMIGATGTDKEGKLLGLVMLLWDSSWEHCPKHGFCCSEILDIAASSKSLSTRCTVRKAIQHPESRARVWKTCHRVLLQYAATGS